MWLHSAVKHSHRSTEAGRQSRQRGREIVGPEGRPRASWFVDGGGTDFPGLVESRWLAWSASTARLDRRVDAVSELRWGHTSRFRGRRYTSNHARSFSPNEIENWQSAARPRGRGAQMRTWVMQMTKRGRREGPKRATYVVHDELAPEGVVPGHHAAQKPATIHRQGQWGVCIDGGRRDDCGRAYCKRRHVRPSCTASRPLRKPATSSTSSSGRSRSCRCVAASAVWPAAAAGPWGDSCGGGGIGRCLRGRSRASTARPARESMRTLGGKVEGRPKAGKATRRTGRSEGVPRSRPHWPLLAVWHPTVA